MKKIISLLLAIGGMIGASCNHKATIACDSCKVRPVTEQIDFHIAGAVFQTNIWQDDMDKAYRFGTSNIRNYKELSKVIAYLQLPVEKGMTPVALYLYAHKQYTSTNASFLPGDLQGLSLYYYQDDVLRHALLIRQADNSFKTSVPALNCRAAGVTFGNMHSIVRLLFRNRFDTISAVGLIATDYIREPGGDRFNDLGEQLEKLERSKMANAALYRPGNPAGGSACTSPCDMHYTKTDCYANRIVCYTLVTCPKNEQAKYAADNETLSPEQITTLYDDDDIYYNFRDGFLDKTFSGKKYINYYYELADAKYLSADIVRHTADALTMIRPKITELLDPSGNGNRVLIDTILRAKLLQLVDLYKARSTTDEEAAMFADVASDIDKYSDLTINDFIKVFK